MSARISRTATAPIVKVPLPARQAVSYLRENADCDLLLLDVEMPEMDGFEVARAIRQLPHLASLPILALTGMMGADVPVRILEAGADGYLSKPVDIGELRSIVSDMIRAKSPDVARAEG